MTQAIQAFSSVRLKEDLEKCGIPKGTKGIVVDDETYGGDAVEVDFGKGHGHVVLYVDDLELIG